MIRARARVKWGTETQVVNRIYKGSGAQRAIDNSVSVQADITSKVIENELANAPMYQWKKSGTKIKQDAVKAVGVVDAGRVFKRDKIYPGTAVYVNLVSSSANPVGTTPGGLGVWSHYLMQWGVGAKGGFLSWTKAVVKRGGIVTGGRG